MKFMRIGEIGAEKPCVLCEDNRVHDISSVVADITPETIPHLRDALKTVEIDTLPVVETDGVRIGSPMTRPRNIYCIGLNYSDHAKEAGMAIPNEPILFNKSSGTFCGPNDPILFAPNMTKLDWEVELGIVIGKRALQISEEEAPDHILGYTIVNDLSERHWQLERGGQWAKGKSFPNFCPTGPWIVTGDVVAEPGNLSMWLDVNGKRMQSGNTNTMIFGVSTIVSYLSQFLQLEPGDLICTGTPPGVGAGMSPQVWLQKGDTVELSIDGLGHQRQLVVPLKNERVST